MIWLLALTLVCPLPALSLKLSLLAVYEEFLLTDVEPTDSLPFSLAYLQTN